MSFKKNVLISTFGLVFSSPLLAMDDTQGDHTTIYEGEGISSGIYLGMSREELMELVASYNPLNVGDHCPDSATSCGFELGERSDRNRPFVSVQFDEDKFVDYITVESGGFYATTYGASIGMEPFEVADIYDAEGFQADRVRRGENHFRVEVDEIGYSYTSTWRCSYNSCSFNSDHHIYYPEN